MSFETLADRGHRELVRGRVVLMLIGYARVSTLDQNEDLQVDALKSAGCERWYVDHASGAKASRPELDRMVEVLREGDVLVVWKLDRLGHSVQNLVDVMNRLQDMGVGFKSLTEQMDTTTPGGVLVFNVFAAMAQFERDLIRERTNAGLKAARSRGRVGGRRHKLSKSDEAMARQLYASKSVTVNEIAQRFRISRGTVYGVLWPRIRAHKEKRTGRTIKHVAVRPTHTFQHLQMTLVFIVFPSAFYCHKDNHRHPSHWISA